MHLLPAVCWPFLKQLKNIQPCGAFAGTGQVIVHTGCVCIWKAIFIPPLFLSMLIKLTVPRKFCLYVLMVHHHWCYPLEHWSGYQPLHIQNSRWWRGEGVVTGTVRDLNNLYSTECFFPDQYRQYRGSIVSIYQIPSGRPGHLLFQKVQCDGDHPRNEPMRSIQHGFGFLAESISLFRINWKTGITRSNLPDGMPYTDICPLNPPDTKL